MLFHTTVLSLVLLMSFVLLQTTGTEDIGEFSNQETSSKITRKLYIYISFSERDPADRG